MTSPPTGPTRRTLVRTAAWTVPIVSIAAAAPAFAASGATSTWTWGSAEKWSQKSEKHVSWDLTLTNGPVAIDTIAITFTYVPKNDRPVTDFEIYGYSETSSRDTSWAYPPIVVPTPTITATHLNDIAAGSTTTIHTDFTSSSNGDGTVSATALITYADKPPVTATQTLGPSSWGSGSSHVHPA